MLSKSLDSSPPHSRNLINRWAAAASPTSEAFTTLSRWHSIICTTFEWQWRRIFTDRQRVIEYSKHSNQELVPFNDAVWLQWSLASPSSSIQDLDWHFQRAIGSGVSTDLDVPNNYYRIECRKHTGRGGSLVYSAPFVRRKDRGFDSRSSRHLGALGKSFTRSCLWRFEVKLRHSIKAVVSSASEYCRPIGLEEAL